MVIVSESFLSDIEPMKQLISKIISGEVTLKQLQEKHRRIERDIIFAKKEYMKNHPELV